MSRVKQGFDSSLRRLSISQQQPSSLLRPLRLEALLSQRELAKRASVAPNTIRNAEDGHIPLRENQELIAAALTAVLERTVSVAELWPPLESEAA